MRIKTIEYENFRNFKEHGEIRCSTDGKMTIIYGKNGDGKTTLHQLFHWIVYGQVKFNKTSTNHLYNLAYESELPYSTNFEVHGRIEFEHSEEQYTITRKFLYKKGLDGSEKIGEDFTLLKMDNATYNWNPVDKPQETIEMLLPSGLAEYFFFDGESMIADLRVKGRDSASKLRKALYSMFDLDVIESALDHIGRTDLKTTVMGKLYLNKSPVASGSAISSTKTNIENAQNELVKLNDNLMKEKDEKESLKVLTREISEKIGNVKSKEEYEKQRKDLKSSRDVFLRNTDSNTGYFGDEILEMFPPLLISKSVIDAKNKLNLKVNSTKLPAGVNKRLITYLLKMTTATCVCGRELSEDDKEYIRAYLELLPPRSYASMYNDFTRTATQWGSGYDKEKIENIIKSILENQEQASDCDKKIKTLDDEEKESKDIEELIVTRQEAENRISDLENLIVDAEKKRDKYEIYLSRQMKEYDRLTEGNEASIKVQYKIDIMKSVAEFFTNKLGKASVEYSEKLQCNIQTLLDAMLTSKRYVSVSKDFAVRVTDSFNDESKSEGQFAVVSFAYIGGILQMLKNDDGLSEKEYPLVLDGPFSKLDPDQRQNVINMLPEFAPQVILFSKDDLHDVIGEDHIGRVWTIQSNHEKNIATIEEGKLWK